VIHLPIFISPIWKRKSLTIGACSPAQRLETVRSIPKALTSSRIRRRQAARYGCDTPPTTSSTGTINGIIIKMGISRTTRADGRTGDSIDHPVNDMIDVLAIETYRE
jgi:hypothetical protein